MPRRGKHRSRVILASVLLSMLFAASAGHARPFRGSVKWSVLLCRFSDGGNLPRTSDYYRNMFFVRGTGGLADYWDYASDGSVNLSGSAVKGWYDMGITKAQGEALDRWGRVDACRNAASSSPNDPYTVPSDHLVAVITFPSIDLFGWTGGAFLPWDVDVGGMAHETGHGIGLNHSFSDDPTYQNASWAAIGEYDDPWDVMSYGNTFRVPTATFGDGPVGPNGFHRDRMGWLPRSRVVTFGADGVGHRTLTLAALNQPSAAGPVLVRVPYDPGDLNRFYTVEFRRQVSWDGGIPVDIVLLHEVMRRADNVYYSFLLRERTGDRNPVQVVNANGVSIRVDAVSAATGQATVTIDSAMVDRCLQGFVWREARPGDLVCVTPQVRGETAQENALAPSRRNPNGGPFGPDTCLQGFVWREAFAGDHACVPPPSRTRAAQDNAQAAARRNPARNAFGPNTCTPGFVWREADDRDWVCVTPAVRQQTAVDNGLAPSRRNPAGGPFGPDTCLQGFVWREAYPGDHVCVVPATRSAAWADNREAPNRLQFP
jgi:hypothetical protein